MNRKQKARVRPDGRSRAGRIQASVVLVDVDHDDPSPCVHDGLERRHERHRGHDDLVPRFETESAKADRERVEPAPGSDREPAAAGGRELALERLDRGAVDERARVEQLRYVSQ